MDSSNSILKYIIIGMIVVLTISVWHIVLPFAIVLIILLATLDQLS